MCEDGKIVDSADRFENPKPYSELFADEYFATKRLLAINAASKMEVDLIDQTMSDLIGEAEEERYEEVLDVIREFTSPKLREYAIATFVRQLGHKELPDLCQIPFSERARIAQDEVDLNIKLENMLETLKGDSTI